MEHVLLILSTLDNEFRFIFSIRVYSKWKQNFSKIAGDRFNIKISSFQHMYFHYKDTIVSWPTNNGNLHTWIEGLYIGTELRALWVLTHGILVTAIQYSASWAPLPMASWYESSQFDILIDISRSSCRESALAHIMSNHSDRRSAITRHQVDWNAWHYLGVTSDAQISSCISFRSIMSVISTWQTVSTSNPAWHYIELPPSTNKSVPKLYLWRCFISVSSHNQVLSYTISLDWD